ncbi:MAG TPA: zinc dependent phospholipase C family protein [Cyclobacteriaceae bacterium]|nr:zinc dependent phospholipase C family protein [Cyclobacteriaceae bacterium]
MKNPFFIAILLISASISVGFWGFFAHHRINRLAVFTLPPEMIGFYKANIEYITEAAVNPDRRRFSVPEEGPRHYIDIDHFGDSALYTMPRFWKEAVNCYSEDTLKTYGILPWHIYTMYFRLKDAFMVKDPDAILKISAELGHYLADAHVPLHTTENHNGQLTGQEGIHAFWESRLPELFSDDYDFFVGHATYLKNPQFEVWHAIESAHRAVDSVLTEEKKLAERFGEKKYSFEAKNKQTLKVYSKDYAKAYHIILNGMVERQMCASIKMIGSFWYTAWIDAGQPDLKSLINYKPSEEQLQRNREELKQWKEMNLKSKERDHEGI